MVLEVERKMWHASAHDLDKASAGAGAGAPHVHAQTEHGLECGTPVVVGLGVTGLR